MTPAHDFPIGRIRTTAGFLADMAAPTPINRHDRTEAECRALCVGQAKNTSLLSYSEDELARALFAIAGPRARTEGR